MATILLAAAGAALGAGFGGAVLGLSGAVIGRAVGATIGRAIDQRVMGLGSDAVEVGRIDRLQIMGASEGAPIPKCWGRVRLPGQIIWASPFKESRKKIGGKGMPSPRIAQYSYSVSIAIALCEGEILGIGRIWADGKEMSQNSLNLRVYSGSEQQLPDPLLETHLGEESAPAYRGVAHVVIESFDISDFGNRIPQLSFEVMRRAQGLSREKILDFQDIIKAVALIPGAGEYALATKKVQKEEGFGIFKVLNVNSPSREPDLIASLSQLNRELPNCKSVSLVVSWFGDDLRCGECKLQPKVENRDLDQMQVPWRSGGIERDAAQIVPYANGRPIYGGTPSDSSVVDAIKKLRLRDQDVMFYPFVLMDQISGNTLLDPYTGLGSQAVLPWRGRITLSVAPGRDGSPDGSVQAEDEVAAFFGGAEVHDFDILDERVVFSGQSAWGYRRFILHYAYLCKMAGGVEAFCIGSEMRELTKIMGSNQSFPAVQQLKRLASDVRQIIGPNVKISYAADWSEYSGHWFGGDFHFHLDDLWSDENIDFVGIDNYMPISDWRNSAIHKDMEWSSVYNLEYLKSCVAGGEGFDWYYSDQNGRIAQERLPIQDEAYGEDWIFRVKDIKSWWSNFHYNRTEATRSNNPTSWFPGSKPIRFTEYGCAAIDKGTNQPNRFLDLRSSESGAPIDSQLNRDDFIQMQYFRAMHEFWHDSFNNPPAWLFDGNMLDAERMYAWAWDARPYPQFPRNTLAWTDGDSYYRGHWLNGRATAVPLDKLIDDICSASSIEATQTSTLFGSVSGYISAETQSGRSRIQPLGQTYAFDSCERDGFLHFKSRGIISSVEIALESSSVDFEDRSSIELTRLSDGVAINRARLCHIDLDGDFALQVSEAAHPTVLNSATFDTEFSLSLSRSYANQVVQRWILEATLLQDRLSVSLPPSLSNVQIGDAIYCFNSKYRVDRLELGSDIKIEAVRHEDSIYQTGENFRPELQWGLHSEPGGVVFMWLDVPIITSGSNNHSPRVAISSNTMNGPTTVWSSFEGVNYRINTVLKQPSMMGRTCNDLLSCGSGRLDRGVTLEIEMLSGEFDSKDLTSVLNGDNVIAIGDGQPSSWEILQFVEATLVSEGIYKIEGRFRGQFGTESNIPQVWKSGSYVVVLDGSVPNIDLSTDLRGVKCCYRIGHSSLGLGDDFLSNDERSFQFTTLKPYSVVHLRGKYSTNGDHSFMWIRRTRTEGDSWEGNDVPLNEQFERYSVSIKNLAGVVLRKFEVDTPFFSFPESERFQSGLYGQYAVEIAQVSAAYGAGASSLLRFGYEG